ncbi:MAG: HEPN domain-containing protein [Nitrososphaeria archaeon]|nr:HEPN domain-containing protein [Nitrososphaeria archaeon]
MSHANEVKILRRRAEAFYKRALDSLNDGDYDLTSFLSEQAVQLFLKSILLEELGDYPKIHLISNLISILRKVQKYESLVKFFDENKLKIRLMEDAYILSRYTIREYTKEEAEILLEVAKEVLKYGKVY